jgi:hypothetical protein
VHRIPELAGTLADVHLPGAADLADRLLTLPLHHLVDAGDRERIGSLVAGLEPDGPGSRLEGTEHRSPEPAGRSGR